MENFFVRKATPDDLETLLQFEQGIMVAERPFDETLKQDTHYYDLAALIRSDDAEVLVAIVDNEIVGSGYARMEEAKPYNVHSHHAYLGFMYVLPEFRGRGINQEILNSLIAWCRNKGLTELRLDVYEGNLPAIKAYEKAGFKKLLVNMRMGLKEE